jgi:hypothetical protein
MRVFRVLVGMVLLSVAAPALLAGAVAWYAMQHRDAGGEFRATIEAVARPGYAIVVPDFDALLRRDAPVARSGRTSMRIIAEAVSAGDALKTPLFLGLAEPKDAAAFLQDSAYAEIGGVSLARGPLDARTTLIAGARAVPLGHPEDQQMWQRSGLGSLEFEPSHWRGRQVALVVLAPDGVRLDQVSLTASVRFGWLDSTTWGLLILGPVALLLAFVTLAWPTRQVVYVVAGAPGDPGFSLRSGEPVSWKDALTREYAAVAPRPGSIYAPTVAEPPPPSASLSASEVGDWSRPSETPKARLTAGPDQPDPQVQRPSAEQPRHMPVVVDVPTQEMHVLGDPSPAPLLLSGAASSDTVARGAGSGGVVMGGVRGTERR